MSGRLSFLQVVGLLYRTLFGFFPAAIILSMLVSLLHGASLGLITLATQALFDGLLAAIQGQDLRQAMLGVLMIAASLVVNQVLNGIDNFTGQTMRHLTAGKFLFLLHEKAARLSPIAFEQPDTLDVMNKSREGADYAYTVARTGLLLSTFYLSYLAFIGIYLFRLSPVLVVAIPICFAPVILSQIVKSSAFADLEDVQAPKRRRIEIDEQHIVGKPFYRETRILGAYSYLRRRYIDGLRDLGRTELGTRRKVLYREMPLNLATVGAYLLIIMFLIRAFHQATISAGAFVAVLVSVEIMFETFSEIVNLHLGNFSEEVGKARNFVEFLGLQEDRAACEPHPAGRPDRTRATTLLADRVSFAYPANKDKKVLDDVSVYVDEGETVAIVGPNGAGKSTLAKLLMGLYLPDEGKVFIRGADSRLRHCFEKISAVFQTYGRYSATLRENVTISDVRHESQERFEQAVASAKVKVVAYDDMLGREFGGTDVSGGQWQRIAIARGIYRVHDAIILDEPTAAIDPLEEADVYRTFRSVSRGKAAVIVTHRLGAARIADRIYVIDDGRIVESGTHAQLLSAKGLYAEMYETQAKTYVGTGQEFVGANLESDES
ncbi:MAG TPA: ABC transporter ATP-binding protein [Dissulfurispiraceae bacterium]|nr:ABC transporter ATP-binding protein [Dissulfurispiraceae bacterium]